MIIAPVQPPTYFNLSGGIGLRNEEPVVAFKINNDIQIKLEVSVNHKVC